MKYDGRIVRVLRLDDEDVDFIAELSLSKGGILYNYRQINGEGTHIGTLLLEDDEEFGRNLCDYYYVLEVEDLQQLSKEQYGLLSEDTVNYDDDQLAKSYSEALSEEENEGKTIGQLLDVEFGDINFVSDVDKELSTISSKSLSFVEKDLDKDEMVHSPAHYNAGKYEVIDMLEVMADGYEDPKVAYLVATAGKYLFRAPFKNNMKQDLEKAVWYLNRALTHL